MLPLPPNMPARFEALTRILDGMVVAPRVLADRWAYSEQTLANARSAGKGLPWFQTPTGGIRYRLSEILAAELSSTRGPLTVDRVALELEAIPELSDKARHVILSRLKLATGAG
jgi:hypothetical protein